MFAVEATASLTVHEMKRLMVKLDANEPLTEEERRWLFGKVSDAWIETVKR